MKFDFSIINKLSPPKDAVIQLWDLATLSAVITMLVNVVKAGIGGQNASLVNMRMINRYSKSLRDKTRENLNLRIKIWVMQCPIRRAWVRKNIGESAIRKWKKNRLADYALSKYFGDWRSKWPQGFRHKPLKSRIGYMPKHTCADRPYKWKQFSLVKITNVERILFGGHADCPNLTELKAAYHKLWNVSFEERKSLCKWSQPRIKRAIKPVEFTPYELAPKLATDSATPTQNKGEVQIDAKKKSIAYEPENYEMEKIGIKKLYAPPTCKLKNNKKHTEKAKEKPP